MARLPDSKGSRVVLIGSASYTTESGFEPLPPVRQNLAELAKLLRTQTGIAERNICVVEDPADYKAFLTALKQAGEQAQDLLLFYFAGHGVALHGNDLGLTYVNSDAEHPEWSTVNFQLVRKMLLESGARAKMVILDCCHSGNAFGAGAMGTTDPGKALEDLARINGSYVLTATDARKPWAESRGTNECTAFTGALIDVLHAVEPDDPEYLTMDLIYARLRAELISRNHPVPQASGRNSGAALALARRRPPAVEPPSPKTTTSGDDSAREELPAPRGESQGPGQGGESGRLGNDPTTATEAVEGRRRVVDQSSDANLSRLAASISAFANQLSRTGRQEEALAAATEATDRYRQLVERDPNTFLPDLAASISTLANQLSQARRQAEALATATEATDLYRQLVERDPNTFLPDLAASISTLANQLSQARRQAEALATATEATDLYRQLVERDPNTFLPDLAASISTLANQLSQAGRQDEALAAATETVDLFRQLETRYPPVE
ncbi:caspase family protein [Nocardia tengchongensis]|uniref:caspase, EACC1-associated type n=1 Tax=Nocardia tengchongensis TaxID=2055889 RepID=UPI0036B242D1